MFENFITNDYLRSFIVLIILLITLRICVSIFERIALRLVSKTKTDLDDKFLKKASWPITIILFFLALEYALREINITSDINNLIDKILMTGAIIFIAILIYIILDVIIIGVWKKVVKRANAKTLETLSSLLQGIFKVVIILVLILYILDFWGIEITPLLAGLGIAGLAVALALQPTLSNIFSGIAMILDDSVRVGDLVYLDDTNQNSALRGKIQKIGLRSTKVITFDNELIVVPNNKLAESNIHNVALPEPKTRVIIPFQVAYGTDIEKVKKIVLNEIHSIKLVSKDPTPWVIFEEMGSSGLDFKVFFFIESFDDKAIAKDEANTRVYNALNKNKIIIPFLQMDVHLKKD